MYNLKQITPCKCGSQDITHWEPTTSSDRMDQLASLEKIECNQCGRIVYGGDENAIDDWNNERYDD